MNENTTNPRYFRLLEKGEIIKEGDYICNCEGKLHPATITVGDEYDPQTLTVLRPVQVDEWQSYAERKPTKEDSAGGRGVQVLVGDSLYASHHYPKAMPSDVRFWRRVTPPQPAKPKSVQVVLRDFDRVIQRGEVTADGKLKLSCGDVISAESIEEFIKARDGVMAK